MTLLLLLCLPADAASLDLIEVGGLWGSPGAANPTALWWNPAGLAVAGGHRAHIEVAPTIGGITAQRDNPDYGELDPTYFPDGFPESYDYSGSDDISFVGAVPFVGVSSDLGVDGLGLGLGLMVPSGKGGGLEDPNGVNRFALREGSIQHIYTSLGASYRVASKVAFGVSGSMVASRYKVDTDATIYPDLAAGVADIVPNFDIDSYQDGYIEDSAYSTTTVFDLKDTAFTFGGGVYITPVEQLGISLAYNHGVNLLNEGELVYKFGCPPEYDTTNFAAAEQLGTCNTRAVGEGTIGYRLPGRIHLGVVVTPVERLRLELMGAYVFWSVFDEYTITTFVAPTEFPDAAENISAAEAAKLATQDRTWARDNRNTFWLGLDGKGRVSDLFTVGGRVLYDRAAVPDANVSANNYDADAFNLSALVDVTPANPVSFSLSFTQTLLAERVVTDSPYSVAVQQGNTPTRYFYPSANGTYTGSISRIGITMRARLGADPGLD